MKPTKNKRTQRAKRLLKQTRHSLMRTVLDLEKRVARGKAAVDAFDRWCALPDRGSCEADIPTDNAAFERLLAAMDGLKAAVRR